MEPVDTPKVQSRLYEPPTAETMAIEVYMQLPPTARKEPPHAPEETTRLRERLDKAKDMTSETNKAVEALKTVGDVLGRASEYFLGTILTIAGFSLTAAAVIPVFLVAGIAGAFAMTNAAVLGSIQAWLTGDNFDLDNLKLSAIQGAASGFAIGLVALSIPLLLGTVIGGCGCYLCKSSEEREKMVQKIKTTTLELKEHRNETVQQLVSRAKIAFEAR